MRLSFGLAAMKGVRKKKVEGGAKRRRMAIVKADFRSFNFGEILEELLVEILGRLPANSLMRFKCVSKHWFALISSRYVTNLFFKLSSPKQKRRMFLSLPENNGDYALLSPSPNDNLEGAPFHRINQDVSLPGVGGYFVNALRGLMCFRAGRQVRIYNFTTRQLVSLPELEGGAEAGVWNYFGHDPVYDEYKLLSILPLVREEQSDTKVLVLGPGASWRNTRSHAPPHRPYSQGIAIDGVLYYGAWIGKDTCVVMSFHLTSEVFSLIELPILASIFWHPRRANLMNYRGKLAVFDCSRLMTECILDLWVVEDAKHSNWSHKKFALPSRQLMESYGFDELLLHSTCRSGEVRLSDGISPMPLNIIYDLDQNRVIQGVLVGPLDPKFSGTATLHSTLWDDVGSIMYLEV